MEPDWSQLPKDILLVASEKLISIVDYIQFRAVCRVWRSILPPTPYHLPQFPWLMLPSDRNKSEGPDTSAQFFYDLADSRIHNIHLPETSKKEYCSSSCSYVTLADGPDVSLLNLITRETFNLPSLKTSPALAFRPFIPSYVRCQLGIWPYWHGSKKLTDPIIQKTLLLSDPSQDSKCIVMALLKNNWGAALCKIGDECWTLLDEPPKHENYTVIDATYQNGLFYTISRKDIKVYNLRGLRSEVVKIDLPLELAEYHLVDGTSDELLLVAQHLTPDGQSTRENFTIYKLSKLGKPSWVKVTNIGERMIFLCRGHNQCFSFPANNLAKGWGRNMLLSASTSILERHKISLEFEYVIKQVNLTNNDVNVVASFGSHNMSCTQALWITPSLC
ncbi:F-box family protein [Rhynchospora pubera]|uniref:F-box family protein n=1 Tax=Rhynchospora pubera TaxID=906938 RepID=A0AAV8G3U2_9POAL|nr:F-box family protein [Rhynchospora pubera]KAJ4810538.1 F-box family protein [Rhynchospora pubera]